MVGAGPAGSSTAYHLARHGVDVLMVDKALFPREKVCGDGLTPRGVLALQRMDLDPTDAGFTRVDGLRSYGLNGRVVEFPWPRLRSLPDYGVVRTRLEFDHLLAEQAVKAGARFEQGTEAVSPLMDAGWVTGASLSESGTVRDVRARFVVAADGASSRLAGQCGVVRDPTRPLGIAARRYYRTSRPIQRVLETWLNLPDERTGGVMAGYGWIFPLGDGVINVGAGILNSYTSFKETSARKVMDLFLGTLPPEFELDEEHAVGPILSGPIPMGINRRPAAVPGMLLVGDAGGVTNPFNGEGITYGMETGELAAHVLTDALTRGRPAMAQMYPALLRERYGRYYFLGRQWVRAIGHPKVMRSAVRYAFPSSTAMRFALRLMGNLTDGWSGGKSDKVMAAMVALAPSR